MRFLIDVDEVLTNFVERMTPIMAGIMGRDWHFRELPSEEWDIFTALTPGQRDALCAVMERPSFCASFDVVPGAVEAILQLRQHCEVYAVTAPNYFPYWCSERTQWLEKHFGFHFSQVIHTHAKHTVSGDFFLDDRPDHVIEWAEAHPHGHAMLWNTENNSRLRGYEQFRVYSWEEVLQKVKEKAETQ